MPDRQRFDDAFETADARGRRYMKNRERWTVVHGA